MNTKKVIASLMLALSALIWGSSFVAQRVGMEMMGFYSFLTLRSFIGGACIFLFVQLQHKRKEVQNKKNQSLLISGTSCGILLFLASFFQQWGMLFTSVGKAGFITTMYIIIIPILGVFLKRKIAGSTWLSVLIAMIGFCFLCLTNDFSVNIGDILLFISAVFFALHILAIDHFSKITENEKLAALQLVVCGIISCVPMLIFEQLSFSLIKTAWIPLLYTGVLSSGLAYTMQIIAQKNITPVAASLLMSLESVFAVLAGWLILNQILSIKETIGCTLVFIAILLVQLSEHKVHKERDIHL